MEKTERQVPDLKLDEHQKVSIQSKEIPLTINGKDAVVTIKKLSTGVRNKIRSECTDTKIIAGQPSIKVDDAEIQEKMLHACIHKAPFGTSLSEIKDLPAEVSDYLFNEYNMFAEPSDKKKD